MEKPLNLTEGACRTITPNAGLHIGVVIPVYGHSRLVAEAISSVLKQNFDGTLHVVVVIDGDKHEETLQTIQDFLSGPERIISAIYQRNGRLPAARNAGIRYLIQSVPDLFAVYMLDSDNRLSEHSIAAFTDALVSDPSAAWAYPDVTFFGLSLGYSGCDIRETAPTYSVLRHCLGNICEAGSMIRADVFRQGIAYDETFTSGFEDWEFWLQCIRAGHHGVRADNAGFLYRRRADSMLSDANRIGQDISAVLKQKHTSLCCEEALWKLFETGFRPIVYVSRQSAFYRMSTSDHMAELSLEKFCALYQRAYHGDRHFYFPRLLIYPITDVDAPPRISSQVLKTLMAARSSDETHYLNDAGDLSAERRATSLYGVVRLDKVLSKSGCPAELAQAPFCEPIRKATARSRTLPRLVHAGRRYGGPLSSDIDAFISDPLPEKSGPAGLKRCLVIASQTDEKSAPILDSLSGSYKIEVISYELFGQVSQQNFRSTVYNGSRLKYRQYDTPYSIVGKMTAAYDRTYIFDDFSVLFHVGEWKHLAGEVVFVAIRPLSDDQQLSLQGVEHSLAKIVCERSKLPFMRASGIPSHKLTSIEDHFGGAEMLAMTDNLRVQ